MKNLRNSFEKQSFMVESLTDLTAEYKNDDYQSIYYRKPNNNYIWFAIWFDVYLWSSQDSKNKILSCSYSKIWSEFNYRFDMKDIDIQEFIQNMINKHTNWASVTPRGSIWGNPFKCLTIRWGVSNTIE